jgi:hypothetical protein
MKEWISVKDKLPNTEMVSESVLICFHRLCPRCESKTGEYIAVGYYSDMDGSKEWNLTEPLESDYFPNNHCEQMKVTHWMFLPDLP